MILKDQIMLNLNQKEIYVHQHLQILQLNDKGEYFEMEIYLQVKHQENIHILLNKIH